MSVPKAHSWGRSAHAQLFPWGLAADIGAASSAARLETCSLEMSKSSRFVLKHVPCLCGLLVFLMPCANGNSGAGWEIKNGMNSGWTARGTEPFCSLICAGPGLEQCRPVFINYCINMLNCLGKKTWHYSVNGKHESLLISRPSQGIVTAQSCLCWFWWKRSRFSSAGEKLKFWISP